MKIRNGFVSNSSSSSFCIIGVCDKESIQKLKDAEHIDKEEMHNDDYWFDHGAYRKGNSPISFYGSAYDGFYYAGVDAEGLLENNTIPQAKRKFIELIKDKYRIVLTENNVKFLYFEMGDG